MAGRLLRSAAYFVTALAFSTLLLKSVDIRTVFEEPQTSGQTSALNVDVEVAPFVSQAGSAAAVKGESGKLALYESPALYQTVADRGLVQISRKAKFCSFLGHHHLFKRGLPMKVAKDGGITSVQPLIDRIVTYSGVDPGHLKVFAGGKALNAAAVVDRKASNDLQRLIIYHPQFMPYLDRQFTLDRELQSANDSTPWGSVGVFAHEVGHHLAEHTLEINDQRYFELQADWYSGYILGKMGARIESAQGVLSIFWREGSRSHPGSPERLAAITDGWRQAKCELSDGAGCDTSNKQFKSRKIEEPPKCSPGIKIKPQLMCNVGGEQLLVAAETGGIYWLRHYERRCTRAGQLTTGNIVGCDNVLQFALSTGRTIKMCARNSTDPRRMTLATLTSRFPDSSQPEDHLVKASTGRADPRGQGPSGVCVKCEAASGFCPGEL